MSKLVRWNCPNGCGGVNAPRRPRKDDVRRYCLACSEKTGRLVERVAPKLEKKRAEQYERTKVKRRKDYVWKAPEGYYAIPSPNGATALDLWHQFFGTNGKSDLRIRHSKHLGPATFTRTVSRGLVTTVRFPIGFDWHDARAAVAVGAARAYCVIHASGDGPAYLRRIIRWTCEQYLSVRPKLDSLKKAEEEVADLLRSKQAVKNLTAHASLDDDTLGRKAG